MKAKSKHTESNNKSDPQQLTIKDCFVRIAKIKKNKEESSAESSAVASDIEKPVAAETIIASTMETEQDEQPLVKRGRGRPSLKAKKAEQEARKVELKAKRAAEHASASDDDDAGAEEADLSTSEQIAAEKLAVSKVPFKKRKPATPPPVLAEEPRSRRTPKPNPRYVNDNTTTLTKQMVKNDESQSDIDDDGDEGLADHSADDEMDKEKERRKIATPYTGKRRGRPPKSVGKRGTSANRSTPVSEIRKTFPPSSQPAKRKITETDIDIDDEHGKQLFLDAKRRLTHSPHDNSDEDFARSKGKSLPTDSTSPSALAAKLRAKFSGDIPAKRTPTRSPKSTIRISPKFINAKAAREKTLKSPPIRSSSADDNEMSIESADMEDQTPTFTIVNISDIMNQNNEDAVLVRKRKLPTDTKSGNKSKIASTDSSDEDIKKELLSDSESSSKLQQQQNNRRKTQHTKILSDDKLAKNVTPSGGSRTVNNRVVQMKQQISPKGVPLTGSASNVRAVNNKPAILRQAVPPPRILNSSLCKPGKSPNLVTKLVTSDELKNKQNNNTIRSKENNVTSYTFTEKDGKLVQSKRVVTSPVKIVQSPAARTPIRSQVISNRSVPMPKPMPIPMISSVERRMKKITCFETWHVIKTPENKHDEENAILMVDMVKLGNNIKDIQLPSGDWSYTIALAKQNVNVIKKLEGKSPDGKSSCSQTSEIYTGEIFGQDIKEADKHLYKPATIHFRRKPKAGSKLQFDRLIVFKSRKTSIKIDDRPIRLVTAPQFMYSLRDIEILLQIVNDIKLDSADVEILPNTS